MIGIALVYGYVSRRRKKYHYQLYCCYLTITMNFCIFKLLLRIYHSMGVFTAEEVSNRYSEFGILLRYMPFLQEHGFSEYGKGQLTGKMELLQECFSDSLADCFTSHLDASNNYTPGECKSVSDNRKSEVKKPTDTHTGNPSNSRGFINDGSKSGEQEKSYQSIRSASGADTYRVLEDGLERKSFPENARWNIKGDDEPSWIARIRKLTEM